MFQLLNVHLIPSLTEGYEGELADVTVDGGRIQSISAPGTKRTNDQAIDCAGKTLLPGLFDLHMHLYFSTSDLASLVQKKQNENLFDAVKCAKLFLRRGYTTIRDLGNIHYIGTALRDAVNADIVPGPRILTAGRCLSPFAKGNDAFGDLYYEVNTNEEILKACRDECAKGVDFIKYMATGSVLNPSGVPGALITSREEIFALQKSVASLGMNAAVHCHGAEGIKYCAEAGIHTIEHASMIDGESTEIILENGGKSSIVPTLSPVGELYHAAEGSGHPKWLLDKIGEVYDHAQGIVKASRAGVLTGWGTDETYDFYESHPGYEFAVRSEIGYTNTEMLQQATINSAMILGMDDMLGTIKAGKTADLVLVDGDPEKDISCMMADPEAVFKNGKLCYTRGGDNERVR